MITQFIRILIFLVLSLGLFADESEIPFHEAKPVLYEDELSLDPFKDLSDKAYNKAFNTNSSIVLGDNTLNLSSRIERYNSKDFEKIKQDLQKEIDRALVENPNVEIRFLSNLSSSDSTTEREFSTEKLEFEQSAGAKKISFSERFDRWAHKYTSVDDIKIGVQRFVLNGVVISIAILAGKGSLEYTAIAATALSGTSALFSVFSRVYVNVLLKQHMPNTPVMNAKILHILPVEILFNFVALEFAFALIPITIKSSMGHALDVSMLQLGYNIFVVGTLVALAQAIFEHALTVRKEHKMARYTENYKDIESFNRDMKRAKTMLNWGTLVGSAMSVASMVTGTFGKTYSELAYLEWVSYSIIVAMAGVGIWQMRKYTEDGKEYEEAKAERKESYLALKSTKLSDAKDWSLNFLDLMLKTNKQFKYYIKGPSEASKIAASFAEVIDELSMKNKLRSSNACAGVMQ